MGLPLAALPLIIQGATGAAQLVGSLAKKAKRPEYEIPSGLRSALAVAQTMVSNPNMEGYSQAVDQSNLATANMVSAAQQAGNAQESVASVAAAQGAQLREITQMNEQSQRQDLEGLQKMLQVYSQAQDQEWQMNEFAPYADAAQEKRDVFGAGLENVFGAGLSFAMLGQLGGLGNALGDAPSPAPTASTAGSSTSIIQAILGSLSPGQRSSLTGVAGAGFDAARMKELLPMIQKAITSYGR